MRLIALAMLVLLPAAATRSWTTAAPIPQRIQEHHGVLYGGKIYIAGGIDSTNETTTVAYRFDPRRNTWERIADLPEPRHHMPLAVVNDTLYAIGGFDDGARFTPKATLWMYRADKNTWEERAPLPAPRGATAVGVVAGKIVIVGGFGVARALIDTTFVYDPRDNAWTKRAPIPTKRDHLEAQVVGGVLYAIGGRPISPASNFDVVEAYDLATDRWTTRARCQASAAVSRPPFSNGQIHTFGGERTDGVFDNHEVYDPARNAWTVAEPMPTARHGLAAVAVDGKIYVIGGGPKQGFAQTDIVEVWQR